MQKQENHIAIFLSTDSTVTELPPQSTVTFDIGDNIMLCNLDTYNYYVHWLSQFLTAETTSVRQNQNAITSTVVSSVIVFILSSTLFFFIGCVCGWCGHKLKIKRSDKSVISQAAPVYEDLQLSSSMPQDREKSKENVAYGPVWST